MLSPLPRVPTPPGFPIPDPPAWDADPVSVLHADVVWDGDVVETLLAGAETPASHATMVVLGLSHRFEMQRVHAGQYATEVIKSKSWGDRSPVFDEDEPMGHQGPVDSSSWAHSIAIDIEGSLPDPAPGLIDHVPVEVGNPPTGALSRRSMPFPSRIMLGTESLDQLVRGVTVRFGRITSFGHGQTVTGEEVICHG